MNIQNNSADVAREYFQAIQTGNMNTLASLIDENIIWHQPGANQFSGERKGQKAVFEMLGAMMQATAGTFAIDQVHSIMANGEMVAASIHFTGKQGEKAISMDGVDILRIRGGRIVEAWLFSRDQVSEDSFWGAAGQ